MCASVSPSQKKQYFSILEPMRLASCMTEFARATLKMLSVPGPDDEFTESTDGNGMETHMERKRGMGKMEKEE